jgi:chromosome partitioning protein
VANLKGGAGKTTTAVLLAELLAERDGSVLLVDCDPQGSAMTWADQAAEDGPGLRSVALSLPTTDLQRRLTSLRGDHDHIILDTGPGTPGIVRAAMAAAGVVVVPTQPTLMDLDRLDATLSMAEELDRPAVVLLTRVRAGTRASAASREALEANELPVAAHAIPQREAIANAFGTRPSSAALSFYAPLLAELDSLSTERTHA